MNLKPRRKALLLTALAALPLLLLAVGETGWVGSLLALKAVRVYGAFLAAWAAVYFVTRGVHWRRPALAALICLPLAVLGAGFTLVQYTSFTPRCAGADDAAEFTAVIATLGSNTGSIRMPWIGGSRCAVGSVTVPSNVALDFTHSTGLKVNAGATLTVQGDMVGPDGQRRFYGSGTVSFSGNRQVSRFRPQWWGAAGDGSTDDTAPIQSALDGADSAGAGVVFFSKGTYKVTSTLVVNTSGAIKSLSLQGVGPASGSVLLWTGATNTAMVRYNRAKYSEVRGLRFQNAVATGTTVGLLLTGPSTGEQSANIIVSNCIFNLFHYGLQGGESSLSNAAAELLIEKNQFDSNDIGIELQGTGNTLVNELLINSFASNTSYGIRINGGAGDTHIKGGTNTSNGVADIALSLGWNRTVHIDGVRFEMTSPEVAILNLGTIAGTVTVESCDFKTTTGAAPGYAAIQGGGTWNIQSNFFGDGTDTGWIPYSAAGNSLGSLHMESNVIYGTAPFSPGGGSDGMRYGLLHNKQILAGVHTNFTDEEGIISSAARLPLRKMDIPSGNSSPGARQYLRGVIGIAGGSNTSPLNFRNDVTFASAATAAVLFKRTVTDGGMSSNGNTLTSLTAAFTKNDEGRTVTVTTAGVGGGTLTTFITTYVNATTVTLANRSSALVSGQTVVIGENEPDANYNIPPPDCGVNETFWTTSKATTGFTLNSSNASSTATCQWVLIRR